MLMIVRLLLLFEMIFDFARVKQEFLPLTVGDVVVEREKLARILGLIVQGKVGR